ncbi:MAG: hypothetical protein C4326_00010 [Ignavibacteria bacterium]
MSLSSLATSRPVTILMFYIGVVLIGVIAFFNLSVDFLPPIKIPKLTVQTFYANTSPEEVEQRVSEPIEAALATIVGAKRVSSLSREGQSVVTVEFYWGTNMDFAFLEAREKLDQMRGVLPREVGRPTILRVDPSTEPIMTIAVAERQEKAPSVRAAHTTRDALLAQSSVSPVVLLELRETARALLKKRIEQVEGVAQVSVLGGGEREIHVIIDQAKLNAFGLSIEQLSQALAQANLSVPGGTIKRGLFRYPLRTVGEFTSVDDIAKVVVMTTSAGRLVRVKDVAVVRDTVKERMGLTRYNGSEVVALHVRKEAGTNTIEVSRRIHEVLNHLRREYPGIHLAVIADQAEFIAQAVADVQQSIAVGAFLAFAVLYFFLRNPRSPLIIGVTIPVSLLVTFVAMYFFGINLNVISLTGLALGIGMLGDNAIILIENVTRLREKGLSVLEATLEGAKDINLAVTASTLTNVAIFLPIIFVEGVASKLFVDMGVTMTVSLLASLFVAVTLVPMLVSRERVSGVALHPTGVGQPLARLTEAVDQRMRTWLDAYLRWSLQHPGLVAGATIVAMLIAVGVAFTIRSAPAPDIDQSRFTVHLLFPKGSTLDAVSAGSAFVERQLLALPAVEGVYASVGITDEQNIWTASDVAIERAVIEVRVKRAASTPATIEQARRFVMELQRATAGVEYAVSSRGTTFEHILRPEPNDIKIRVTGKDADLAAEIASQYSQRIQNVRGLTDVRVSLQVGMPEYRIAVDRDAAKRHGMTVQSVAAAIRQQIQGAEATTFNEFDMKVTIRVRRDAPEWSSILATPIGSERVPLQELIRWSVTSGAGEIWRENHQRAHLILANVHERPLADVVDELQQHAAAMNLPAGTGIVVGGENEEIRESFRSLFIIILLSLFLVYMILAAEYESVLYPLVILLTSPLAFIGAIAAMVFAGQAYNVLSLIGLVIMIGAVDNDAVIAVDVITSLRRKGVPLHLAIRDGMQQRLRPIVMTTATTVLGILPLFFEFGTGSELVRALTVPIVGGLVASTLFTVLAIPVVYTFVDRWIHRSSSDGNEPALLNEKI